MVGGATSVLQWLASPSGKSRRELTGATATTRRWKQDMCEQAEGNARLNGGLTATERALVPSHAALTEAQRIKRVQAREEREAARLEKATAKAERRRAWNEGVGGFTRSSDGTPMMPVALPASHYSARSSSSIEGHIPLVEEEQTPEEARSAEEEEAVTSRLLFEQALARSRRSREHAHQHTHVLRREEAQMEQAKIIMAPNGHRLGAC